MAENERPIRDHVEYRDYLSRAITPNGAHSQSALAQTRQRNRRAVGRKGHPGLAQSLFNIVCVSADNGDRSTHPMKNK
jgi:hypothetical protein